MGQDRSTAMRRISHRQVEAFQAVVGTGSMTDAARRLHNSQSNVSRLISDLELEVGFALFHRSPGGLVLTDDGSALFTEVDRSFRGLKEITNAAAEIKASGRGSIISIATTPAFGYGLLPRAITQFRRQFEQTRILLHSVNSASVPRMVMSGQADIGLTGNFEGFDGLRSVFQIQGIGRCIVPAGDSLAALEVVTPRDLSNRDFISLWTNDRSREQSTGYSRNATFNETSCFKRDTPNSLARWFPKGWASALSIRSHLPGPIEQRSA